MVIVSDNSYLSVADADSYLGLSINGPSWASAANKDQALVTATRLIDRQLWVGKPTSPLQLLAWPRSGVFDHYNEPVDDSVVPKFILDATAELALALVIDPSLLDKLTMDTNIKRLEAGSAKIEFFKGELRGRFPAIIEELLGFYLKGATKVFGSLASGTDEASQLRDYKIGEPYA